MNKAAIVLGTSSGLGLASAESLLERGFFVFGGSRTESPIDHPNFEDLELDLTNELQIRRFISEVKSETEVVDVLINAAGICEMGPLGETTSQDIKNHLEINVIGYFNFLKHFEKLLLVEETQIINLFSISAKNYFENTSAYTASEFAKKGLLGVIEKEWKKYQLRFTNLYMGAIDTPIWEEYSEVEIENMLSIDDFLYALDCILDAPSSLKIPELTLLNREGFID